MQSDVLDIESRGPVDWVTMNRPDALNALNGELTEALAAYFEGLYRKLETRVVVLRGAGRGFCSGADLSGGLGNGSSASSLAHAGTKMQRRIGDIYRAMRRCPQPIVSLINGAACGGGFSLLLASDVRIAGPKAKMNAAFIRIGLTGCDMGSSYLLPRLVGASVASELLLTGRFVFAEEAREIGLVSRLVDEADLEGAADEMVEQMLAASPMGLRMTKESLTHGIDASSLDAAMAMEDRQQVLILHTADQGEALGAFLEKRPPSYEDK